MPAPTTSLPDAAALEALLLTDRRRLERLRDRLLERQARGQPVARELARLRDDLAAATRRAAQRSAAVPAIHYPEELPVSQRIEDIREALRGHPVVVVCGETGSGKTTQLPKACLEVGGGRRGLIGHTQPRRLAARTVAARLAEELGTELGREVGFKVRFTEKASEHSLIRVMTDGILLAEIREDPELLRYDTLIIDEAHERSLNIDFLLGYLKRLRPRRPDLRLVITSATIDPQRFAAFFDGAPVIEVSGRTWPVELRYRPPAADEDDDLDPGLVPAIVAAVDELEREPPASRGDVLVFLPGEREIREAAEALGRAHGGRLDVLPLYSRLAWGDQQRVFERGGRRRVVLATNVAETSITVPGIRAVVDSGLARISRYSPRSKILRLPVEPVSQASADQRKGRCGRVGPGICIRLYGEDDYAARPAFTPPEILRTNLASVILQMEVLGLGAMDEFPFLDRPDTRQVNDGYRLLQELEAVDEQRRVTELGRLLARLPVDPRLGRMLVEARRFGALAEVLTLVAVLSTQDPRERPAGLQAEADARHAAFADPRSDFVGLLNLWNAWQAVRRERSANQARRWCRDNFLSAMRMREWENLRDQLAELAAELDWRESERPASYEALHRALLPGLLGGIGERSEQGDYLGVRGLRFVIAPGTPLRNKPPRWVAAAALAETQRVYARTVAAIEPAWIETAAHHLVKRSYAEPEWSEERGYVGARETVTLYGLTVAAGRRVNYGAVAPAEARSVFVREALVHGRCRLRRRFVERNARTRRGLEALEARLRRRGVLVDEEAIAAFYLRRVPAGVHDLPGFEHWLSEGGEAAERSLVFTAEEVVPAGAPRPDPALLPDALTLAGHALALDYRFEPGASDDGASLRVPLPLLASLDAGELEWGVPAWRAEKLTDAIRGLPKTVRRLLVPAPDVAARCLAELGAPAGSLFEAAAAWFSRACGAPVTAAELRAVPLAEHLRLNLRVLDLDGRVLAEGRDLEALRDQLRAERGRVLERSAEGFAREGLRDWDLGDLPATVVVRRQGLRLELHPALEDRGASVALTLCESAAEALRRSRAGVRRLLALRLEAPLKHVRKMLAADGELALLHQPVGPLKRLVDEVCDRVVERCCLGAEGRLPRTAEEFAAALERGRPDLYEEGVRLAGLVKRALAERRAAARELAAVPEGVDAALAADVAEQLAALFADGFVGATPDPWLESLPRYARAIARRAHKLRGARGSAAGPQLELRQWRQHCAALAAQCRRRGLPAPEPVERLRWWVEEYGVSLFAQELRTSVPVSAKRLQGVLDEARAAVATG